MAILRKLFGGADRGDEGDPLSMSIETPRHARQLVKLYAKDCWSDEHAWSFTLKDTPAGRRLTSLEPPATRLVVLALLEQLTHMSGREKTPYYAQARMLLAYDALTRRSLPYVAEDLEVMLFYDRERGVGHYGAPPSNALKACEVFAEAAVLPDTVKEGLTLWMRQLTRGRKGAGISKAKARVEKLLGLEEAHRIAPGEAWADQALRDLDGLDEPLRRAWSALLVHMPDVRGGKPNAKWIKRARELLAAVGPREFDVRVRQWFALVDKRPETEMHAARWERDPNVTLTEDSSDVIKGLVWASTLIEGDCKEMARSLGALALSAYRKVPGIGPRAPKVGNACVNALGTMPGTVPVGQLGLIKMRVKYKPAQKGITKSMAAAAERAGIGPDELEEMGVPTYGLSEVGLGRDSIGEFEAVIQVEDARSVTLGWRKADGQGGWKSQKTVPQAVKTEHPDAIKELRATLKDIRALLSAQRERIDGLFLLQRSWSIGAWRERYLDHPLVGVLARRLIWRFKREGEEPVAGAFLEGEVVGPDDRPLKPEPGMMVDLWHPIHETTESVTAWRDWFRRHAITQPFKQAYREV